MSERTVIAVVRATYVYVIARQEHDRAVSPIKIGISDNPDKRLSTIRVSCPFPVEYLHSFGPMTRPEALRHENGLHDAYKDNRMQGEWFDVEPDEIMDLLERGGVAV
jgi:hypothetical protein